MTERHFTLISSDLYQDVITLDSDDDKETIIFVHTRTEINPPNIRVFYSNERFTFEEGIKKGRSGEISEIQKSQIADICDQTGLGYLYLDFQDVPILLDGKQKGFAPLLQKSQTLDASIKDSINFKPERCANIKEDPSTLLSYVNEVRQDEKIEDHEPLHVFSDLKIRYLKDEKLTEVLELNKVIVVGIDELRKYVQSLIGSKDTDERLILVDQKGKVLEKVQNIDPEVRSIYAITHKQIILKEIGGDNSSICIIDGDNNISKAWLEKVDYKVTNENGAKDFNIQDVKFYKSSVDSSSHYEELQFSEENSIQIPEGNPHLLYYNTQRIKLKFKLGIHEQISYLDIVPSMEPDSISKIVKAKFGIETDDFQLIYEGNQMSHNQVLEKITSHQIQNEAKFEIKTKGCLLNVYQHKEMIDFAIIPTNDNSIESFISNFEQKTSKKLVFLTEEDKEDFQKSLASNAAIDVTQDLILCPTILDTCCYYKPSYKSVLSYTKQQLMQAGQKGFTIHNPFDGFKLIEEGEEGDNPSSLFVIPQDYVLLVPHQIFKVDVEFIKKAKFCPNAKDLFQKSVYFEETDAQIQEAIKRLKEEKEAENDKQKKLNDEPEDETIILEQSNEIELHMLTIDIEKQEFHPFSTFKTKPPFQNLSRITTRQEANSQQNEATKNGEDVENIQLKVKDTTEGSNTSAIVFLADDDVHLHRFELDNHPLKYKIPFTSPKLCDTDWVIEGIRKSIQDNYLEVSDNCKLEEMLDYQLTTYVDDKEYKKEDVSPFRQTKRIKHTTLLMFTRMVKLDIGRDYDSFYHVKSRKISDFLTEIANMAFQLENYMYMFVDYEYDEKYVRLQYKALHVNFSRKLVYYLEDGKSLVLTKRVYPSIFTIRKQARLLLGESSNAVNDIKIAGLNDDEEVPLLTLLEQITEPFNISVFIIYKSDKIPMIPYVQSKDIGFMPIEDFDPAHEKGFELALTKGLNLKKKDKIKKPYTFKKLELRRGDEKGIDPMEIKRLKKLFLDQDQFFYLNYHDKSFDDTLTRALLYLGFLLTAWDLISDFLTINEYFTINQQTIAIILIVLVTLNYLYSTLVFWGMTNRQNPISTIRGSDRIFLVKRKLFLLLSPFGIAQIYKQYFDYLIGRKILVNSMDFIDLPEKLLEVIPSFLFALYIQVSTNNFTLLLMLSLISSVISMVKDDLKEQQARIHILLVNKSTLVFIGEFILSLVEVLGRAIILVLFVLVTLPIGIWIIVVSFCLIISPYVIALFSDQKKGCKARLIMGIRLFILCIIFGIFTFIYSVFKKSSVSLLFANKDVRKYVYGSAQLIYKYLIIMKIAVVLGPAICLIVMRDELFEVDLWYTLFILGLSCGGVSLIVQSFELAIYIRDKKKIHRNNKFQLEKNQRARRSSTIKQGSVFKI